MAWPAPALFIRVPSRGAGGRPRGAGAGLDDLCRAAATGPLGGADRRRLLLRHADAVLHLSGAACATETGLARGGRFVPGAGRRGSAQLRGWRGGLAGLPGGSLAPRSAEAGEWRFWPAGSGWLQAGALGGTFAAVGLGLAWYNFARFGNPLEMGTSYMFTNPFRSGGNVGLHFIKFNGFIYYAAPAQWSRYFPFAKMIHLPPVPPGYASTEFVHGLLVDFPFAWLALLAPLAWRRRPSGRVRRPQGIHRPGGRVLSCRSAGCSWVLWPRPRATWSISTPR